MSTKAYRKTLRKIITEFNSKIGKSKEQAITLKELNQFRTDVSALEKEAGRVVKSKLEQEMYLFYLSLQCLTSISLAMHGEHGNSNVNSVYPADWINLEGDPNPNFVVKNTVVQIVNYSLAIGNLIEDGLDSPARAILKTNNELIFQLLILMSDRQTFKNFCLCETEDESVKKWYKIFAKGKLTDRIEKLEVILGLPKEYLADLKLWRKEAEQFYHNSVLHSFSTTHQAAFSLDFDNHELSSAILGSASAASIQTLEHINFQLWYAIVLFFKVLEIICEFEVPLDNQFWYRASVCKECVNFLFLDTYHHDI